jgi:hypothetical protein
MKNRLLKYYIVAIYLCSTVVLFAAQPGADDTTGPGDLEGADAPAPIDNYVWVLALIGLVFIFLKFRAIQNKKVNS